jgi:hypothetical protein
MSKLILGIDPGANGALALFAPESGELIWVKDMPNKRMQLSTGKITYKVDFDALYEIFEILKTNEINLNYTITVHIEKVQAYGKQSAPAAFNFGYAAAIPYALARAFNFEVKFVHPAVWKRAIGLQASAKDEARELAIKLFPTFKEQLRLKKYVDRADAILIASHLF